MGNRVYHALGYENTNEINNIATEHEVKESVATDTNACPVKENGTLSNGKPNGKRHKNSLKKLNGETKPSMNNNSSVKGTSKKNKKTRKSIVESSPQHSDIIDEATMQEFNEICDILSKRPVSKTYDPKDEVRVRPPSSRPASHSTGIRDSMLSTTTASKRDSSRYSDDVHIISSEIPHTYVEDDHLYPEAVTPSKVDPSLTGEDYNVPYMDDVAFFDEDWYLGGHDMERWFDVAPIITMKDLDFAESECGSANGKGKIPDGGFPHRRNRLFGCMGRR